MSRAADLYPEDGSPGAFESPPPGTTPSPGAGAAYLLEDAGTECLLTPAEFTELYHREVGTPHRHRPEGSRVSFGERLLASRRSRSAQRRKADSKLGLSPNQSGSPRAQGKRGGGRGHPRAQSVPRGAAPPRPPAGPAGDAAAERGGLAAAWPEGPVPPTYLAQFDAKFRRRQIPRTLPPSEELYVDLLVLKQRVGDLEAEAVTLRTVARRRERERALAERRIEELIASGGVLDNPALRSERAVAEGHLTQSLRNKIRTLETSLTHATEELTRLRLDTRALRVRELEAEAKAYYSEARRLQRLLDRLTAARDADGEVRAMDEALALLRDREAVIVRLREAVAALRQALSQRDAARARDDGERLPAGAGHGTDSPNGRRLSEEHSPPRSPESDAEGSRERLEDTARRLESREREVARLTDQLQSARAEQEVLKGEHTELREAHSRLEAHSADLEAELKDLQHDLRRATERRESTDSDSREAEDRPAGRGPSDPVPNGRDEWFKLFRLEAASAHAESPLVAAAAATEDDRYDGEEDVRALKDRLAALQSELTDGPEARARLQKKVDALQHEHDDELAALRSALESKSAELRETHEAALGAERLRAEEVQREADRWRKEAVDLTALLEAERSDKLRADESQQREADRWRKEAADLAVLLENARSTHAPRRMSSDSRCSPRSSSNSSRGSGRSARFSPVIRPPSPEPPAAGPSPPTPTKELATGRLAESPPQVSRNSSISSSTPMVDTIIRVQPPSPAPVDVPEPPPDRPTDTGGDPPDDAEGVVSRPILDRGYSSDFAAESGGSP
jgi:hypothetical protein